MSLSLGEGVVSNTVLKREGSGGGDADLPKLLGSSESDVRKWKRRTKRLICHDVVAVSLAVSWDGRAVT